MLRLGGSGSSDKATAVPVKVESRAGQLIIPITGTWPALRCPQRERRSYKRFTPGARLQVRQTQCSAGRHIAEECCTATPATVAPITT